MPNPWFIMSYLGIPAYNNQVKFTKEKQYKRKGRRPNKNVDVAYPVVSSRDRMEVHVMGVMRRGSLINAI